MKRDEQSAPEDPAEITELVTDTNAGEDDSDYIRLKKATLSWLGVFVKDTRNPQNSFPNRYWIEFGHNLDGMEGWRWLEQVHPDDQERVRSFMEEVYCTPRHAGATRYRVKDSTGVWHWVLSKGMVESVDDTGTPVRFVGFDHDITEIQRLERELREAQEFAEQQAREAEVLRSGGAIITSSLSASDAAWNLARHIGEVVPIDDMVVFESRERALCALARALVIPAERPEESGDHDDASRASLTAVSSDPVDRFFLRPVGRETLHGVMRRRAPDVVREPARASSFWLTIPMISRNNVVGVVAINRRDAQDFTGTEIRFCMAMTDYMAMALVNARLYEDMSMIATTDQLSSLLTRRAFFERSEALVLGARTGTPVTVLILDIDHFKSINDDYGHRTGDAAIRAIAAVFSENLREGDIIGRYGGEEFCALLPETSLEEGRHVAQRICDRAAGTAVSGIERRMTVSIGVASTERGEVSGGLSELLDAADSALYVAKRSGRNQVQVAQ